MVLEARAAKVNRAERGSVDVFDDGRRILSGRSNLNMPLKFNRMKSAHSSPQPAQLLCSGKSTPASRAAYIVDDAIRSVVDADVLREVDCATGEIFYARVFSTVYGELRQAIFQIWRASAHSS